MRKVMMTKLLILLFVGLLRGAWSPPVAQLADRLWTPAELVAVAAADRLAVPHERAKHVRWLSLNGLVRADRPQAARIMSFVLNLLSTERAMTPAAVVPGCEGALLRVYLDDYALQGWAWDRLAARGSGPEDAQLGDPYFTWVRQVERPVQKGRDIEVVREHRPDVEALGVTVGTKYPILRADWFLYFATLAPSYYELLGLGDEKSVNDGEKIFERLVFADPSLAAKARVQSKGVVVFSTVAQRNRTLTRFPTISGTFGGYWWESHDTRKAIKDRDYVNVLLDEKFDAKEIIATLTNGLQAYLVTDAKGKRVDVADINIAADKESKFRDPQVWAARNCIVCHSQGLRDITDEVRGLSQDKVSLLVPLERAGDARRIRDLYFSVGMQEVIEHDRALYAKAVAQATFMPGLPALTPQATSSAFESLAYNYYDRPVTLEQAAREIGWEPDKLVAVLKAAKGIDHTLTGFLQTPPRPVRRDQFEVSFSQLAALTQGVRP